jgi:tetratricopeptide (TPR) repeat protein
MFAYEFHLKAEAASNLGRFSEAQALAIQAIAADPENGDGYASLGRALFGLDKPVEAEKQFRAALERSAENSWYLRCLAISLKMQSRFREALPIVDK